MEPVEPHIADVAAVGHFCIDSILLPSRPHAMVVLGGSVTYVSLVAKRLGASASIISRVGGDFPKAYMWWLQDEGIDLSGVVRVEAEQTTRFELKYSSDLSERMLRLKSKASPISLNDVPASFRAKAVHLAPIAGEISVEVAELMKSRAEVVSLDPQGLLRTFGTDGNVSFSSPADARLLEIVNICKSSQEEIKAFTGKADVNSAIEAVHDYGVNTVIVTQGAKGAVLSVENTLYNIPTCAPKAVVDPTGAGDVFMGAFLTEFIRAKDSFWCACVGSAAASLVVEGLGPTFFGEKEEIYRRAESAYESNPK